MIEIMIIRPEKEIGMGCCGGICSDPDGFIHMEDEFKHHDEDRERLGEIYLRTIQNYEDVHISFLDPRNLLAMVVYFSKQVKQRNISLIKACHHLLFHMKYNSMFINGEWMQDMQAYEAKLKKFVQT